MYRLLVVDDEPFVRKGILSLIPFEQLGINETYEASNGKEAWEKVMEVEPHVILCDINMPKLNGLDFSRQVKERYPWIKIGLITGYDYFDYAKTAVKIGVEDYVLKPVSKQDVIEVLSNLIKKIEQDTTIEVVYKSIRSEQQDSGEPDPTGYKKKIDAVIDTYISEPDLSLSLLGDRLGLSISYLSSLFKKIYGIPFQDYILQARLEKSKMLLLTTALKNYEIAEKVGIADPNYFSTLFRKKYGVSPKQYKQKITKR